MYFVGDYATAIGSPGSAGDQAFQAAMRTSITTAPVALPPASVLSIATAPSIVATVQLANAGLTTVLNKAVELGQVNFTVGGVAYVAQSSAGGGGGGGSTPVVWAAVGGAVGALVLIFLAVLVMTHRKRTAGGVVKLDNEAGMAMVDLSSPVSVSAQTAAASGGWLPVSGGTGTALHVAVAAGDRAMLERLLALLAAPAEVDSSIEDDGSSPGSIPRMSQSPASLSLSPVTVVPAGPKADSSSPPGPARAAVQSQSERVMLDARDAGGCTALAYAVRTQQPDLAERLLLHGASPLLADSAGQTPLHHACRLPDPGPAAKLVQLLLHFGADTSALTSEGETALLCGCSSGQAAAVQVLLEHCMRRKSGLGAAWPDRLGRTALMVACASGHASIVQCLLSFVSDRGSSFADNFVDINARDVLGRTALHWAVSAEEVECARLLLYMRRLEPALPDQQGNTPLHCAARTGSAVLVRLLLSRDVTRGALVSLLATANSNEQTPGDIAQTLGNDECAGLLQAVRNDPTSAQLWRLSDDSESEVACRQAPPSAAAAPKKSRSGSRKKLGSSGSGLAAPPSYVDVPGASALSPAQGAYLVMDASSEPAARSQCAPGQNATPKSPPLSPTGGSTPLSPHLSWLGPPHEEGLDLLAASDLTFDESLFPVS